MKSWTFNPEERERKGTEPHIILFTPKGKSEQETVTVYAKNRLDASNKMILAGVYGEQHEIITKFDF